MTSNESREQAVEQCLQQMDALVQELEGAMSAIAANAPAAFERSLRLQQGRVGALVSALELARKPGGALDSPSAGDSYPGNLDSRLSKAARKLWGLNEQYASLIEHSGRSIRMLRALYGHPSSLPSQSRAHAGILDQYQTWSWEG